MSEGEGEQAADVIFSCDGETYVMVMYGRLTPEDAIMAGKLDWDGDETAGLGLRRPFPGRLERNDSHPLTLSLLLRPQGAISGH